MKYRRFGSLDWYASILGFGTMRLPIIGGDYSNVDEDEAIKMIRYGIEHGINYIDTAYGYHGGKSEIIVGKAIEGYRNRVRIATKMPIWLVNSHLDMDRVLNEQLNRLNVDYIDFYLLHGLNSTRWKKLKELNVFEWLNHVLAEGKIKYVGFSFHDSFEVFKEIIDFYNWTMCQIQYNYLDINYQAGIRGLKYAASKGIAIVVMEPLAGGILVTPPLEVIKIFNEAKVKRSIVEWALLWVWNHPEVSVALSGMSSMQQVIENIKYADNAIPNILSQEELELFDRARAILTTIGFINCSGCKYCQPCPNGVLIPEIFAYYNLYFIMCRNPSIIDEYNTKIPFQGKAENCIKCGICESLCPQRIEIRFWLDRARRLFSRPPR
ncbi:MAG: aldo/keto reductase [Candidatus Methanomethylicia archaeon]|nr:aldo/keto reductase [Candidatus Methanomethylicia archaeon]